MADKHHVISNLYFHRYIKQFTEIFTEEGRRSVKITHQVPGQQPTVTYTHTIPSYTPAQQTTAGTTSAQTLLTQAQSLATSITASQVRRRRMLGLTHWPLGDLNENLDKWCSIQIARFMGPTWGPSGADRTQVGPMLAPWTLLSGKLIVVIGGWDISCKNALRWMSLDLIYDKSTMVLAMADRQQAIIWANIDQGWCQ